MKKILFALAVIGIFACARPALAQGGCDDTPENPTLILGGLAAGAVGINQLRTRLRAGRAAK